MLRNCLGSKLAVCPNEVIKTLTVGQIGLNFVSAAYATIRTCIRAQIQVAYTLEFNGQLKLLLICQAVIKLALPTLKALLEDSIVFDNGYVQV